MSHSCHEEISDRCCRRHAVFHMFSNKSDRFSASPPLPMSQKRRNVVERCPPTTRRSTTSRSPRGRRRGELPVHSSQGVRLALIGQGAGEHGRGGQESPVGPGPASRPRICPRGRCRTTRKHVRTFASPHDPSAVPSRPSYRRRPPRPHRGRSAGLIGQRHHRARCRPRFPGGRSCGHPPGHGHRAVSHCWRGRSQCAGDHRLRRSG